jgi:hypothetical protein
LLGFVVMRMLEARFYPRRKGQPDVVSVGYLVWRREGRREVPVFEPGVATVSSPVLTKLRYFIALTAPDSYERLQSLRSEFWSFVRITADGKPFHQPD